VVRRGGKGAATGLAWLGGPSVGAVEQAGSRVGPKKAFSFIA
jgi:hypothetical protein